MKKLLALAILPVALAACTNAEVVSSNLSKAADQFEIHRRVVFYNGITGEYILTIEGKCSLQPQAGHQLQVVCKNGPSAYKKHFLGLSDNVTYFAEQLSDANVSEYHYKVIFKPQVIIPDIDAKGSLTDLVTPR